MKSVFKYEITSANEVTIVAPQVLRWLHVAVQHGVPCVWAEVDTETEHATHRLCVRGTGHPMKGNEGRHIGTLFLDDGAFVFHVFETLE